MTKVYVDMGCLSSDTAQLNFDFANPNVNRLWEIKVTQIPCNTEGHPRGSGCLQYHTGITGQLSTFNFLPTNDNHLANQEYSICIRPEKGMCCIEYSVCPDINSYSFHAVEPDPAVQMALAGIACSTTDYIGIEGAQAFCDSSSHAAQFTQLCGQKFNVINAITADALNLCDCSKPFQVDIFFNDQTDNAIAGDLNTARSRGKFIGPPNSSSTKKRYDAHAKDLSPLLVDDKVAIQDAITKLWDRSGTIVCGGPYRDYHVVLPNGKMIWRNRRFLRIGKSQDKSLDEISGTGVYFPAPEPGLRRSTRPQKKQIHFQL
eukprot:snap_masked-scaffold2011_size22674-processed-gene-0.0 protein:Tk10419 transcript:snap_masked-scaffold2011_size22674-processed-gene-0.0-mRNA-1 annotation:"hypothetical protein SINV_00302"